MSNTQQALNKSFDLVYLKGLFILIHWSIWLPRRWSYRMPWPPALSRQEALSPQCHSGGFLFHAKQCPPNSLKMAVLASKQKSKNIWGSSSFPSTTQAAIPLFLFKFKKRKNISPKFLGKIQRQLFPSYFEEVLNPSLVDIGFSEGNWPSAKAIRAMSSEWGFQNEILQPHQAEKQTQPSEPTNRASPSMDIQRYYTHAAEASLSFSGQSMGPERHVFPLQQAKVKLKGMFHFLLERVTSFLEGEENHTGLCSQATWSDYTTCYVPVWTLEIQWCRTNTYIGRSHLVGADGKTPTICTCVSTISHAVQEFKLQSYRVR